MSKPLVIDYLRTSSFQRLEDEHGVVARFSNDGTKASLNYDQILVKSGDVLAEQCRGLIIRPTQWNWNVFRDNWKVPTVGDCNVVAWPMNRFYNHGDAAAADIVWSDPGLSVYEKLDGTMVVLYWDVLKRRWFTATRSVPEADLPIQTGNLSLGEMTFSTLFREALVATGARTHERLNLDEILTHFDPELTYVFELTSPHNRIVVKYDEPGVTLLAARHTASGIEKSIHDLNRSLHWLPRPKVWAIHDPTALAAFVDSADPATLEGAVVCDSQFNRIKIKNKAWVLSSRAKDLVTVSRRSAMEAIISGTIDDVIPLISDDIANELLTMKERLVTYLRRIDENFRSWKDEAAGNRRRFAELVNLSDEWATPYFQMLDGKGSDAHTWLTNAQAMGRLTPTQLDVLLRATSK